MKNTYTLKISKKERNKISNIEFVFFPNLSTALICNNGQIKYMNFYHALSIAQRIYKRSINNEINNKYKIYGNVINLFTKKQTLLDKLKKEKKIVISGLITSKS